MPTPVSTVCGAKLLRKVAFKPLGPELAEHLKRKHRPPTGKAKLWKLPFDEQRYASLYFNFPISLDVSHLNFGFRSVNSVEKEAAATEHTGGSLILSILGLRGEGGNLLVYLRGASGACSPEKLVAHQL